MWDKSRNDNGSGCAQSIEAGILDDNYDPLPPGRELSVAGRAVKIEEDEAEDIQTVQQLVDLFSKKVS